MSCLPVSRFRCWCWYICMLMFGVDKFMLSAYMFLLVCLHVDVGMFMCYCSFGMFTCWCWYVYALLLILVFLHVDIGMFINTLLLMLVCLHVHVGMLTCCYRYAYMSLLTLVCIHVRFCHLEGEVEEQHSMNQSILYNHGMPHTLPYLHVSITLQHASHQLL